jgi:hypothetical protein
MDEDRGDPGSGVARQVVEAGDLLELALDPLGDLEDRVLEGGPGQAACTTIVRKVKAGSSLRPRRKNDRLPARTAAIIK